MARKGWKQGCLLPECKSDANGKRDEVIKIVLVHLVRYNSSDIVRERCNDTAICLFTDFFSRDCTLLHCT